MFLYYLIKKVPEELPCLKKKKSWVFLFFYKLSKSLISVTSLLTSLLSLFIARTIS